MGFYAPFRRFIGQRPAEELAEERAEWEAERCPCYITWRISPPRKAVTAIRIPPITERKTRPVAKRLWILHRQRKFPA